MIIFRFLPEINANNNMTLNKRAFFKSNLRTWLVQYSKEWGYIR